MKSLPLLVSSSRDLVIFVLTDAFTWGKECEVTYAQPSFRPRVIMKDISIEMLAILSVSDCCIQVMDVYNKLTEKQAISSSHR